MNPIPFRSFFSSFVFLALVFPWSSSAAENSASKNEGPSPSAQLQREHDATLVVLGEMAEESARIRRTGEVDRERIRKMLDFAQNFTDRCHHAKEERFYFPAALVYSRGELRPMIEEVEAEHDQGRAGLQEIAYLMERDVDNTPALIADRLDRYATMMREHIGKENQLLFTQADIVLPVAEKEAMLHGFARIEKVELGEGFHEKYHQLAKDLAVQNMEKGGGR